MSNYEEKARSNYFKVKDIEKFKEFLEKYYLTYIEEKEAGLSGFIADDGLPWCDPETNEEIDFPKLLSKHLCKDEVAIIMLIGSENMKYMNGVAMAVNSRGTTVSINLYDIYNKAKRLTKIPESITMAEY